MIHQQPGTIPVKDAKDRLVYGQKQHLSAKQHPQSHISGLLKQHQISQQIQHDDQTDLPQGDPAPFLFFFLYQIPDRSDHIQQHQYDQKIFGQLNNYIGQ